MAANGDANEIGVNLDDIKAGILNLLRSNVRTGFTARQIFDFLFDEKGAKSESAKLMDVVNKALDNLLNEKAITRKSISTKSGMKFYFRIA